MFGLLYQPALWAHESDFSTNYTACLEAAQGDDHEVLVCVKDETARQDERLNRAYQKLQKLLPSDRQAPLKEAQRAWIKFRDAYGDYLLIEDGGLAATVNRDTWFMQSTANQADLLEDEVWIYDADDTK